MKKKLLIILVFFVLVGIAFAENIFFAGEQAQLSDFQCLLTNTCLDKLKTLEDCALSCDFNSSKDYELEKFLDYNSAKALFPTKFIRLFPDNNDFSVSTSYRLPEISQKSIDLAATKTRTKQTITITNNTNKATTKIMQLQFLSDYLDYSFNGDFNSANSVPAKLTKLNPNVLARIDFLDKEKQPIGYYDWEDLADFNAIVFVSKEKEKALITTTFLVSLKPFSTIVIDPEYDMNATMIGQYDANFLGARAVDTLGFGNIAWGDADCDGMNDDAAIPEVSSDPKGRSGAGTIRIVMNAGTKMGEIDLNDVITYDKNIIGSVANALIGYYGVAFGDADADNCKNDLFVAAYTTSVKERNTAGIGYLIKNLSSKPSEIDLNDTTAYDANFLGAAATNRLGGGTAAFGDADGDGFSDDLAIQAHTASPKGRSSAGIVYVVLNVGTKTGENDFNDTTKFDKNILGATASNQTGFGQLLWIDADADGTKDDLLVPAFSGTPKARTFAGIVYLLLNVSAKPAEIDLNDTTAFDKNILGSVASDTLGAFGIIAGDSDADGVEDDVAIAAYGGDPKGRSAAGIVYLIENLSTKPNEIDLNDTTAYDANFLGSIANDNLGNGRISLGDMDGGKTKNDLCMGAYVADKLGRNNSGAIYCVFNVGTKTEVDLNDTVNHDVNIVGAVAGDLLGYAGSMFEDADDDGYFDDIIFGAYNADPKGRSAAGIVYKFNFVGRDDLNILFPVNTESFVVGTLIDLNFSLASNDRNATDLNIDINYNATQEQGGTIIATDKNVARDLNCIVDANTVPDSTVSSSGYTGNYTAIDETKSDLNILDYLNCAGLTTCTTNLTTQDTNLIKRVQKITAWIDANVWFVGASSTRDITVDVSLDGTTWLGAQTYTVNNTPATWKSFDFNTITTNVSTANVQLKIAVASGMNQTAVYAAFLDIQNVNYDANNAPIECTYRWDSNGASAGNHYLVAKLLDTNSGRTDWNAGTNYFTLTSAGGGTCDCPASGQWNIADGSVCQLTNTCNLGSNKVAITNGTLRITSTGRIQSTASIKISVFPPNGQLNLDSGAKIG